MKRANPGMRGPLCLAWRRGVRRLPPSLPPPGGGGEAGRVTCINAGPAAGGYRPRMVSAPAPSSLPARLQDDVQGIVTGTLFTAFGIFLMKSAGLVAGGTVGLALLLHYASGFDLGATLFVINLPFYAIAWKRMGRAFTLRTAIAVSLLSILSWWLPRVVTLQIDGALAAVLGGLLCGAGMLILFRHGASLGGLNVLVLRLQDRFGWPAGKTQMALDATIVLAGGWFAGDLRRLALSVLAVVALNLALVYNHRPGRYRPA
jgi:uncharacterized membrane-anchored protein YitT (DUF2179 family)